MLQTISKSGRRARPPKWWSIAASKIPKIHLKFIGPASWTPELAQKWIDSVPAKCPFERQLWWGNTLLLYIPPLCVLNPLSSQLYDIRLEAQTYLSDIRIKNSQFKD